jgi:hypothetical protein
MDKNLRILQIQSLINAVARHDFYYAMADDHGAYNAGLKSLDHVHMLGKVIRDQGLALAIWNHFTPEDYRHTKKEGKA